MFDSLSSLSVDRIREVSTPSCETGRHENVPTALQFTDNESNYSPHKGHWVKWVLRVGKLLAQVVIADDVLFYRSFTASNGYLAQLGY